MSRLGLNSGSFVTLWGWEEEEYQVENTCPVQSKCIPLFDSESRRFVAAAAAPDKS